MDVAVVTGGASGVGRAVVDVLAGPRTAVVAVDLSWDDSGSLTADAHRVTGDVSDQTTWEEVVAVADRLGSISKVVFCAAKLQVGTVLDVTEDDFRSVLDVNVLSTVTGLKAIVPRLIANGVGSIVAIASTDAMYAEQGLAAYCVSKGALLQLIRCVAVDFARDGVRANVVCPGPIDTPFFRRHADSASDPDRFLADVLDRQPDGRLLSPSDVARVVAFLLSDSSIGMTGSTVMVDGGLTATFDFAPPTAALSATPERASE